MAKKGDKGLFLPLNINLDEWEQQLMTADAELQRAMRKMKSAVKDLKLNYSVEIEGAKAAGDKLKVLELETARLNQLYSIQKRTVDALNKAYEKQVAQTGAQSKASRDLAKQLAIETKEMHQLQQQINASAFNLGAKISDGIANISPAFASAREVIRGVSTDLAKLTGNAKASVAVLSKVGAVAAAGYAVYKGADKITKDLEDTAKAAAQANEPIYQLREALNLTYEEAEELYGVMRLDGVNAETFGTALNKLNKQLLTAGENGNAATDMLQRYGVELRKQDGTRKSAIEQVKALSEGYKKAVSEGRGNDFLTSTLGAGSNQFSHILADWDGYAKRLENVRVQIKKNYDASHLLMEMENHVAEATRNLAAVKGERFTESGVEVMQMRINALKAEAELYKVLIPEQDKYVKNAKDIAKARINAETTFSLMGDIYKTKLANAGAEVLELGTAFTKVKDEAKNADPEFQSLVSNFAKIGEYSRKLALLIFPYGRVAVEPIKQISSVAELAKKKIEEVELAAEKAKIDEEIKKKYKLDEVEQPKTEDPEAIRKQKKEMEEMAKAREKLNREIWEETASEYDKAIRRIEDEKNANIKATNDKLQAEELYAIKKAKIDEQFYQKDAAQRKKQLEETVNAYNKMAEAQKKSRESAMSEAERTLTSNIKIIRKAMREMQAGNPNWQADTAAYADRQWMRQNGVRSSDIDALQIIGVDVVKQLANTTERLFGRFATPETAQPTQNVTNNNTANVTIEKPIVTDYAFVRQIAEQVAGIITPIFEQKVQANSFK